MTSDQAVEAVIDALNALGVPYMLTGSLANNFYGAPRTGLDADLVVQLPNDAVTTLTRRLGPRFRIDPKLSCESAAATTWYIITLADQPFMINLFLLSDDPHDQERFNRRRRVHPMNRDAWVATAEDVIITKLEWSRQGRRSLDVEDARNVLAVQKGRLDLAYAERWCRLHGTWDMFLDLQRSLEGIV